MSTTIPPNNNTGLYNSTSNPVPVNDNILANNISATGNVTVDGYIYSAGSITTNSNFVGNLIGNVTGNITLPTGNTQVVYNNSGVFGGTPAFTFNQATDVLSVTGNIAGGYFLGNGSQLTGLPQSYGNSNVVTLLAEFGSNTVSTTGNITAGYVLGNGSQLTGLPATYGNSNVAAFLPTYSGNLNPDTISATGNITGLNLKTSGTQGNIVGANYVTADYFVGDGSQLTNVVAISTTVDSGQVIFSQDGQFTGDGGLIYDVDPTSPTYHTLIATVVNTGVVNTDTLNAGYANIQTGILGNIETASGITSINMGGGGGSGQIIWATNPPTETYRQLGNIISGPSASYQGQLLNITTEFGLDYFDNSQSRYISQLHLETSPFTTEKASLTAQLSSWDFGNAESVGIHIDVGGYQEFPTANTNINLYKSHANIAGDSHYFDFNVGDGVLRTDGVLSAVGNVYGNNIYGGGIGEFANVTVSGQYGNLDVGSKTPGGGFEFATPHGINFHTAGLGTLESNYNSRIEGSGGSDGPDGDGNLTFYAATAEFDANVKVIGDVEVGDLGNSVWSNVTLGNLLAYGNITSSGGYFVGDGGYLSNISGGSGSYSNANVAEYLPTYGGTILANLINFTNNSGVIEQGDQRITITGNATQVNTGAYFNDTGEAAIFANSYVAIATNTTSNVNPTWTFDQFGNLSAPGNISAVGNITGNYFIGNGSALTGITATASPGGANTQLQFNNATAFAGNVLMTFNNTTGNIGLGNLNINTNTIQTNVAVDLANANSFGTTTPWRITMGNAYNGSANSIYTIQNVGTITAPTNSPRLLVADLQTIPNTGVRSTELTTQLWANLSANISNTTTRISAQRSDLYLGGGTNGYAITASNVSTLAVVNSVQGYVGAGTNANLSLVGNVALSAGMTGVFSSVTVGTYSSANLIVGFTGSLSASNPNATAFGNATTQLGAIMAFVGAPANANITGTTTAIGYYMPGFTQIIPGVNNTNGNIARQATNYYSFRSDDTLAKAQLGSLSSFNEYTGNITSTGGALTVDKSVGQVQQVYTTEAITTVTFSNFITRVQKPNATYANQSDTVTLIVQQGATPYAVTMPSGTAYRYAGGANIVTATANTTTMISITGTYNYNTTADQYLITISPAFS